MFIEAFNNIRLSKRTRVFTTKGVDWQTYTIPPEILALSIFMMGAGGGGGNGFAAAAAAARGGGGGGGSGGLFRCVVPTLLLPDTLFLQPGVVAAPDLVDIFNEVTVGLRPTLISEKL